jgi:hypothetical protein
MPENRERRSTDGGKSQDKQARSSSGAPEHSLQEREYRDPQGNIHHHTNTYEEQHRGERSR